MPRPLQAPRRLSLPLALVSALCTLHGALSCSCLAQRSPLECGAGSIAVHVDVKAESTCNLWDDISSQPGLNIRLWNATVREVIKDDSTGGLPLTAGEDITVTTLADSCQLALQNGASYILYGSPDELRTLSASGSRQRRRALGLDSAVASPGIVQQCCAAGETCCGNECIAVDLLAARLCPVVSNCCGSGEPGSGAEHPLPPFLSDDDVDSNDDDEYEYEYEDANACCASTEYCCGGTCVSEEEDPPRSCPPAGESPRCCQKSDPFSPGGDESVPPPLDCICGKIYLPVCHRAVLMDYRNECSAICEGVKAEDLVPGKCSDLTDRDNPAPDCRQVLQDINGKPKGHLAISGCPSWAVQVNPTLNEVRQAKVACGAAALDTVTVELPSQAAPDVRRNCSCPRVRQPLCNKKTGAVYSNECQARCDGVRLQDFTAGTCDASSNPGEISAAFSNKPALLFVQLGVTSLLVFSVA